MRTKQILIAFLICLIVYFAVGVSLFVHSTQTHNQFKENRKSFAIDSVQYHQPGRDNTLQVTPYWKCHLKGTNHWIRVTEKKEVGDSLSMIIR
jgi:hypothetical protein